MKKSILIALCLLSTAAFSRELNLCHNFEKGDFPCDDALCKQYKDDLNSVTSCIVGKGGTAPSTSSKIEVKRKTTATL